MRNERMRLLNRLTPAVILLGLTAALAVLHAAEFDESRRVVVAAMRRVFRGPDALIEKAAAGEANENEKRKLLMVLKGMAAVPAAHGDPASWKAKTEALVAAAQDLVDGKDGARDRLRAASACKGCHTAHRVEQE
jgi:cytochrome c556